jgi:hypothetical protein
MISGGTKRATLTGAYTPASSGLYTLQIENTSYQYSSTCIYSYLDNVSLEPDVSDLSADALNIPCDTGKLVNFQLSAGIQNAGKDYLVLMSISGTYPGITVSGVTIPLNYDTVFEMVLSNPSFPGATGFLGVLDSSGNASASMKCPIDTRMTFVGIPLHFAYVLPSPGPSLPLSYTSHAVHVKYIP